LLDWIGFWIGFFSCNSEFSNSADVIESFRKKLLQQMPNSASPKTSAFAVEELSRMEVQMKVLEDRYDTIQKRLGGVMKQEGSGCAG